MAKAALALVGLAAAVGIGLAIRSADAANSEGEHNDDANDNDNIDTGDDVIVPAPDLPPLPDQSPGIPPGQGSGGGTPGSGNGTPLILNPLDPLFPFPEPGGSPFQIPVGNLTVWPAPFDSMGLLGLSAIEFRGVKNFGPEAVPFAEWLSRGQQIVPNETMPDLWIWVSLENPDDWISAFRKYDPPGSIPPARFIEYQASPASKNAAWMRSNILKR